MGRPVTGPNDYGVSVDYAVCRACGAKRPRERMCGPTPVCVDLDWCIQRQRALRASGIDPKAKPARAPKKRRKSHQRAARPVLRDSGGKAGTPK